MIKNRRYREFILKEDLPLTEAGTIFSWNFRQSAFTDLDNHHRFSSTELSNLPSWFKEVQITQGTRLGELELETRVINCLRCVPELDDWSFNKSTILDLSRVSKKTLLSFRNIGKITISEIEYIVNWVGLKLKP